MKKVIGFFSSDATELYKDDIYRSSALPNDYIIYFRYRKKYIDENLLTRFDQLKNQEGIIFFSIGNDQTTSEEKRQLQNISIRKVEISKVEEDHNTGSIFFYLSLKDFIDCDIKNIQDSSKLPPFKFVSEIQVEEGINNKWIDRVEKLREIFKDPIFIKVDKIRQQEKNLDVQLSKSLDGTESFYELDEENEYFLQISFYDNSKGECNYNICQESKLISTNHQKDHLVGATIDKKSFNIITHTLDTNKVATYLNIAINNKITEHIHEVPIKLYIKRTKNKHLLFGALSFLASLGLLTGQLGARLAQNQKIYICILIILVGSILIGIGSASLFNLFNKK